MQRIPRGHQSIIKRLFTKDTSPEWLLQTSFYIEIISVIMVNDPFLMEVVSRQLGRLQEGALYIILFLTMTLQLSIECSILRMLYPFLIESIIIKTFPHNIILITIILVATLIDIFKTTNCNFSDQIADTSDWIKIWHYLSLSLRVITQNFISQEILNSILLAKNLLMLLYRTRTLRKNYFLQLLHQNLYLICSVFALQKIYIKSSQNTMSMEEHLVVLGIITILFNFIFYYQNEKRKLQRCQQVLRKKCQPIEGIWWIMSVLSSCRMTLKQRSVISNVIKQCLNQNSQLKKLPPLQIKSKHLYIATLKNLFNKEGSKNFASFLANVYISIYLKENPLKIILRLIKQYQNFNIVSIFGRIHLFRVEQDILIEIQNFKLHDFDISKYLLNESLIQKMSQCTIVYKQIWADLANTQSCVLQRFEKNIKKFISLNQFLESQIDKQGVVVQTMEIYAQFIYFIEKNPSKYEIIMKNVDKSLEKISLYNHSNSLFLQISLSQEELGKIVLIGQNCVKLTGYSKSQLQNINELVPKSLRFEHNKAIKQSFANPVIQRFNIHSDASTYLQNAQGFCQQVQVQLNLFYDFYRLFMIGRIVFKEQPQLFKCNQTQLIPLITPDQIINISLPKNGQLKTQLTIRKQISIRSKYVDIYTVKSICINDQDLIQLGGSNIGSSLSQSEGISLFVREKQQQVKTNFRNKKLGFLIVFIIIFYLCLVLNDCFKMYVCNDRLISQEYVTRIYTDQISNEFQILQIIIQGYKLQSKRKNPNFELEISANFIYLLNSNRIINKNIQDKFELSTTDIFYGQKVETTIFLQVEKLNSAVSSLVSTFLAYQNPHQIKNVVSFYDISYEILSDMMNNVQTVINSLLIFKKKIISYTFKLKQLYQTLHIVGFTLTIILAVKFVVILLLLKIYTQNFKDKLMHTTSLLKPRQISSILKGAYNFESIINGRKAGEKSDSQYFNENIDKNYSKNSSFANIDSNMEFRINPSDALKLYSLNKVGFDSVLSSVIHKKKSKDQEQMVKKQTQKGNKQNLIYYILLAAIVCIISTIATLPFMHSRQKSCGLVPYLQNSFNLQSLPSSYLYLYISFLQYSLSQFADSALYSRALQRYNATAVEYTKFNSFYSNNPSFAEFNVLKFNIDLANIQSYVDYSFLDSLTPEWETKLIQNNVANSISAGISLIKVLADQEASLSDGRYHILIDIYLVYIRIFDKLLRMYQIGSENRRSSLFQIQKIYYWIELGFLLALAFFVYRVCKNAIIARRNCKVVFSLINKSMLTLGSMQCK